MRRPTTRAAALAFVVALGSLAACGDDDDSETTASDAPAESTEDATAAPATPGAAAPDPAADPAGGKTKPEVQVPEAAPTELVVTDIEPGTGAAAAAGQKLSMHYVGVAFSDKQQFDSSWDRGAPFEFTLGAGEVIDGWDQGLVGMQVGGRRQLVIPGALGYGPGGLDPDGADGPTPPIIKPNETLVFVVDLLAVS